MSTIIAVWLAFFAPPSPEAIRAFQVTAPRYLTSTTAEWHIIAARAAGIVHHVRPELLLAIAHHESRYVVTTRTKENARRESCGVMTPFPKARCSPQELTMLTGYDVGAEHLSLWLTHCKSHEVCALLSYAGGGGLVRACAVGPWPTTHGTNACDVASEFLRDASVISRALHAAR